MDSWVLLLIYQKQPDQVLSWCFHWVFRVWSFLIASYSCSLLTKFDISLLKLTTEFLACRPGRNFRQHSHRDAIHFSNFRLCAWTAADWNFLFMDWAVVLSELRSNCLWKSQEVGCFRVARPSASDIINHTAFSHLKSSWVIHTLQDPLSAWRSILQMYSHTALHCLEERGRWFPKKQRFSG